ncbi:MAG: redoxin family protein [Proteobacteria bacterium]|nr:redoxin family protein [Pseudomonadota bacterium]
MRFKVFTLLAVVGLLVLVAAYDRRSDVPTSALNDAVVAPAPVQHPAVPDVPLPLTTGQTVRFADLKEPLLLVNFWASWCAPCVAELPDMVRLSAASGGQIALVAISVDDDKAAMSRFMAYLRHSVGAEVFDSARLYWVWDGADKAISLTAFGGVKVPETVIVNAERRMVHKIAGTYPWADAATPAMLRKLAAN